MPVVSTFDYYQSPALPANRATMDEDNKPEGEEEEETKKDDTDTEDE